jgi:hypothetical protein
MGGIEGPAGPANAVPLSDIVCIAGPPLIVATLMHFNYFSVDNK